MGLKPILHNTIPANNGRFRRTLTPKGIETFSSNLKEEIVLCLEGHYPPKGIETIIAVTILQHF